MVQKFLFCSQDSLNEVKFKYMQHISNYVYVQSKCQHPEDQSDSQLKFETPTILDMKILHNFVADQII